MPTQRILRPATPASDVQTAKFAAEAAGARMVAEVSVTSAGIVAIGALMASILLSSAAIVWAAQRTKNPPAE